MIDGDTLKISGTRIRLLELTLQKKVKFVVNPTENIIAANKPQRPSPKRYLDENLLFQKI